MKKRVICLLAALLCLIALAGCKAVDEIKVKMDVDVLSKAQKIVVSDAAGNEKADLAEKEEVAAFVDAVNIKGWRYAKLPNSLTEAGSFAVRQGKDQELCIFRFYADGDYLNMETGWIDIPFSIPSEAANYLRGLAA